MAWGPLVCISDSPLSRRITARVSVQCSAHAAEPGPFHHHGLVNDDDGLALALDVGGTTIKAELVVTVSALGDRGGVIGAALLARDGWAPES